MNATSQRPHRLYRSRSNSTFMGICGGMAEYYGFNLTALRLLAFLMIFFTFPIGLIVYILLGVVIPLAPDRPFADSADEQFYNTVHASPSLAMDGVLRRYEKLDKRLQRLESIVTSNEWAAREELKNL